MNIFSLQSFVELLDEVVIGKTKDYTWVIDHEPGNGILRTIQSVSAREASQSIVGNSTTIAAHTEHISWTLENALAFLQTNKPSGEWTESWRIKTVTHNEWTRLHADLKTVYDKIVSNISGRDSFPDPMLLTGLLAMLPHMAYHLGAIRQILSTMKKQREKEIT